jgi:hypothetical protein
MTILWTAMMLTALWGANLAPAVLHVTAPSRQSAEINKSNWEQDPRIIAIREIVSATNAALTSGALKTEQRKYESCPDFEALFILRRIARDAKGGVPWYADYSEAQEDSRDFQYYYDSAGRLRFVYVIARSGNGTRELLRIYFDEAGQRIWKMDELQKGTGCPGCFLRYDKSDKGLVFEPGKAFANDKGCKEMKGDPGKK